MSSVIIYTKSTCPFCIKAKKLLATKQIAYQEIDIGNDPILKDTMIKKSGGKGTVPQIFINNTAIGGCDDLYFLEETGKLDKLLNLI
jgi:glutaredoxin 3